MWLKTIGEIAIYFKGLLLNSGTTKPTKKKQPYLIMFSTTKVGLQIIKIIHKFMKNLVFGFIATVLFSFNSTAQTTSQDWLKIMESYKSSVSSILSKECPINMDVEKFRTSLILGENKLSSNGLAEITKLTSPLKIMVKNLQLNIN